LLIKTVGANRWCVYRYFLPLYFCPHTHRPNGPFDL
jgi:hypothetical protein